MMFDKSPKYSISAADVDLDGVDTIERYSIGKVSVYITQDGRYLIREPAMGEAEELYDTIVKIVSGKASLDCFVCYCYSEFFFYRS